MPMDNIYQMVPPPTMVAAARSTVKLALEGNDGPFVRVQLPREIGQEAIELLRTRALELYQMSHPEQTLKDAKVHLTYRDSENDLCFLFSGDDLQSALSCSAGPLRVLARVEIPAVSIPAVPNPSASTQTVHHYCEGSFTNLPVHKVIDTVIGVLTAASVALQKNACVDSPTVSAAANAETPAGNRGVSETAVADAAESTPLVCPFIHGRHTCDGCLTSPIIGKRFHALNLPNYDLCTACKDKYKGDEITFEEAENEHDVQMQERWKRRFSKWAKKSDKHHENWARKQMRRAGSEHGSSGPSGRVCGGGRHWNRHRSFNPPPENPEQSQGQVEQTQGQTEQTNGEVDQALKEAIRLSVLEVQANNHKEHKAETSTKGSETSENSSKAYSGGNEKPVEVQVEEAIQEAENALKKVGPALKQAIRRSVRNVKNSAKKVEEEVLKEVGPALQEAIRWSMQRGGRKTPPKQPAEENQEKAPEPKKPAEEAVSPVMVEPRIVVQATSPNVETASPVTVAPQEDEFVIPPEAPIGAYPAPSAPTECEEDKVVASVTSDAMKDENCAEMDKKEFSDEDAKENDEVATAVGYATEDVAVVNEGTTQEQKCNPFEDTGDVVVVDVSEDLKPTATILDSEEDEEDSNSWDDGNNSWGMVDEDGEVLVDDEALANAAQVIGSALFESGISSQPTSATSTPIVMFDVESPMMRWSEPLSKLHELGFDDDKVNIEIMERLEAGDIGSGTYEEISVERIVNELMKGW